MRNNNQDIQYSNEDWQNCIVSTTQKPQKGNDFFSDEPIRFSNKFKRSIHQESYESHPQSFESNLRSLLDTYNEPHFQNENNCWKNPQHMLSSEEIKSESNRKGAKYQKSNVYSKNYREKKKEYVKNLQEENTFLKVKIDDLYKRLRQKQMELDRIKFSTTRQEFNIQKLNQEIKEKITLISNFDSKSQTEQLKKVQSFMTQKKNQQFVKFYETYGFGGKESKQLLKYYTNEFLQNVIRDKERYYLLKCIRKKGSAQQKSPLDIVLSQTFQQTQDDFKKSIKFSELMKPIFIELTEVCKNFYKSYQKVIKMLQNIHQMGKFQFSQDIESKRRSLRIILWFQNHQYDKQMRNLRAEWMDLIQKDEQISQIVDKSTKKKVNC